MLARSLSGESVMGTTRRLTQCNTGAMRQDIKLNVPPELDQASSSSLVRVTIVVCSAVDADWTRRRMSTTTSSGADVKRFSISLTVVLESLSAHVR